ncbi:hypothetical protein SAMN00790413_04531 [Deinococcus hopiensis KR-140]|uniref:Uncharacterized protein n=1 Tax=Deinococcus hopiensis KR-140 TaxID=695939 RepID=A0A1W1UJN9_9DEIO|nr:hypothetical protein SAMN00790413_04531 [Deinococcus hopiensis KR-140]
METRLKALAQRAEDLRRHCPYRFYSMSPEDVQTWLDRHYVPTPLGWSPDDAQRLGPLLGLPVPGDYLAFLEVLGNLHHGLFGYDNDLRTPEDYVRFRQECLEYDLEAWDGADQDPQFAEMVRSSLFLNTLGGFAVWYLLCGSTEPTSVRTWLEGDVGATGRFEVEGLFIENIEARMDRFECRVKLYRDLGGTLVYGRGGQIPAGHAIGGELLDLPHDGWSVELTESQLQRIRVMWRTAEL